MYPDASPNPAYASTAFATGLAAPFNFKRESEGWGVADGTLAHVQADAPRPCRSDRRASGILLERRSVNLLRHSHTGDGSSWRVVNLEPPTPSRLWRGPFGGPSIRLRDTRETGHHVFYQDSDAVTERVCFSAFLKADDLEKVVLLINDHGDHNVRAGFDLRTGVVLTMASEGAASSPAAGIQPLDRGWWRCWISGVLPPATSNRAHVFLVDRDSLGYVGRGRGVHVWGLQLEPGDRPTSYIPSDASPRLRAGETLGIVMPSGLATHGVGIGCEATTVASRAPLLHLDWGEEQLMVSQLGDSYEVALHRGDRGMARFRAPVPNTAAASRRVALRLSPLEAELWAAGRSLGALAFTPKARVRTILFGQGLSAASRWNGVLTGACVHADPLSDWAMRAISV